MDPLAIIELQRWGFPGVTKCRHRSIEFLTTQADQSKRDILIDYVLSLVYLLYLKVANLRTVYRNTYSSKMIFFLMKTQ